MSPGVPRRCRPASQITSPGIGAAPTTPARRLPARGEERELIWPDAMEFQGAGHAIGFLAAAALYG
ncbi:hypothetical protein ACIP2X_10125 [Streptomyces sp. NPDC089424]|uniref:hypothetical protein n=1 Tax=Streptomyces sp. NPDC089424 TaxID=3365917 RepID=UPI00381720A5